MCHWLENRAKTEQKKGCVYSMPLLHTTLNTEHTWAADMKMPSVTSNPYGQQKPPKQAISPGCSLRPILHHLHQTHFKVVLKEVVGFPKVFLIIPIVEALTDGVILELPPLAVIHSLTLASIILGIIHTQGFFLSQDIIPKLKKINQHLGKIFAKAKKMSPVIL